MPENNCKIQGQIGEIDKTIEELKARKESLQKELETPQKKVAKLYENKIVGEPKYWCGENHLYWFAINLDGSGDYYNDHFASRLKDMGLQLTAITGGGKTLIFGKIPKS